MLGFRRPEEPDDFESTVAGARVRVAQKAVGGSLCDRDFPKLWSDFKAHFAKAQHGKCGYCEVRVSGVCDGDVEHYRPKGALQELPQDRARLGKERSHSTRADGRELEWLCDRAYSWLAYEWSNYLLACPSCNQVWKQCLFPILESPRCIPPRETSWETPLLLSPFGSLNPVRHLRFTDLGSIEPREESPYGRATIDTCGLDRETLRMSRSEKAKQAYGLVAKLIEAQASPEVDEREEQKILKDIRRLGHPSTIHAGMVRSIVETETCVAWEELIGSND